MEPNKDKKRKNVVKTLILVGVLIIFLCVLGIGLAVFLLNPIGPDSAQRIYLIGQKQTFNDGSELLIELDKENERFIYSMTDTSQSLHCFYFYFSNMPYSPNPIRETNSAEFIYTDSDGNEIVFDETGYYRYNGSKIIYISYKNANDEIKTSINENGFTLETEQGSFYMR